MARPKTQQIAIVFNILIIYAIITIKALSLESDASIEANSLESNIFGKTTLQRRRRETDVECSSNLTVNIEGGVITSPRYPELYPNNLHCDWLLTSSTTSNIVLKFTDVSIEGAPDCGYDYLTIYDGNGSVVEKICGSHNNKVVVMNSTNARITFDSDDSYTEMGFSLEYFLEVESDCQTMFNDNQGILTSPLYPENYPDNMDCQSLIIVKPDAVIVLKFDVLNIEFDAKCAYDYVKVYDGETTDSPLLGHFCSDPGNITLRSTNNTMMVHFHSDQLLNYNGFRANYNAISPEKENTGGCTWEKEINNGTISSPNYPKKYPSNAKCMIKIEAPEGYVISISLDDISLETDNNCTYDRLEIRDGVNEESPLLGHFCGRIDELRHVISTTNGVSIAFTSDSFTELNGFRLEYQIRGKENKSVLPSTLLPLPTIKPSSPGSFIEFPQDVSAISGQSHIMACKPKDRKANVQWIKDGITIQSAPNLDLIENGTILWIHTISEEWKGTYTCSATAENGTIYLVTTQLGMIERAEKCNLIFRHTPKNTTILEGDTKFIKCSLSNTKSTITWTKNGIPFETGVNYQQLLNGFLLIAEASLNMSGVYTCVGKEEETGCVRHYSALVTVSPRINIENACGRPKKENQEKLRGKIVGGSRAQKGAYPWQAMLANYNGKSFCGGALLNEHWIVTAAHCFYVRNTDDLIDLSTTIIKLGKHNQKITEPEEIITGIEDFFLHPQFERKTFDNDIAMVKLVDNIQFTDHISPVCLGDHKFIRDTLFKKDLPMGTVTGWGRLKEKGLLPVYLQEVRVPIVNWETCNKSTVHKVTTNMFCAGYAEETIGDACYGDSGGPFVMEHDNIWYLVGVVSWGEGCGRKGHYGFYTVVANYHSWIKSIMN